MDFDEFTGREQRAGHLPFLAERGDEGGQYDQPGVGHEFGDFGDAADVFGAVLIAKAEVAVQAVADVVAVEQIGVTSGSE